MGISWWMNENDCSLTYMEGSSLVTKLDKYGNRIIGYLNFFNCSDILLYYYLRNNFFTSELLR